MENIDLKQLAEYLRQNMTPKDRLALQRLKISKRRHYGAYKDDPIGYVENILRIDSLWHKQMEILEALVKHQKVMVMSGNSIGKTHIAACAISWFVDTHVPDESKNEACMALSTAPSEQHVKDVLWREIRTQRNGRDLLPKAPRLEYSHNWFAEGFTTRNQEAFKGRHPKYLLVVFDEAIGVDRMFFQAADTMVSHPDNHRWLIIFNPTDPTSYVYDLYVREDWHKIRLSALEHPNIIAGLKGLEPPIPSAVSYTWVLDQLKHECIKITESDVEVGDFEWPPRFTPECKNGTCEHEHQWYRPSPFFSHAVLGQWPSGASDSLWTPALIDFCEKTQFPIPDPSWSIDATEQFVVRFGAPEIGIDPAYQGRDFTAIAVRWGRSLVHAELRQGWEPAWTAGRAKQLANHWAKLARLSPYEIPIKIDKDMFGHAIAQHKGDYRFILISGANRALKENKYANRRSELWVNTVEMAKKREIEWSRLSDEHKRLLSRELLAASHHPDSRGRTFVEKKDQIKKKIGRSPDLADAVNLACMRIWRPKREIVVPEHDRYENFYGYTGNTPSKNWMLA